MADEMTIEDDGHDEKPNMFDQPDGVDWFLAHLVNQAEYGIETGITLVIGGQTVSGVLIPGRRYFEELAVVIRTTATAKAPEGQDPKEWLDNIAEIYGGFAAAYPERPFLDQVNQPRSYFHLRNATFAVGSAVEQRPLGPLLRGKLANVAAFVVGEATSR